MRLPPIPILSGGGYIAGLNAGTRTRPGAGSPTATFLIVREKRGASLIRLPASNCSGCGKRSHRSALSRSRARLIPSTPPGEAYFQDRDRALALRASSAFRATLLRQQPGLCPGCRQVIQVDEEVDLHHRDGNHQNNHLGNLVLLHPNCHWQEHYAPEPTPASSRPSRGVGQA